MARLSSGEGLALLKRPLRFKRGDKGPFIVDIQAMFAKLGFDPGEPEGVFVAKTEDAVRVFQAEYGLPVTGIIDAKTLKFLYEEADPGGYPAVLIEGEGTDAEDTDAEETDAEETNAQEAVAGGKTAADDETVAREGFKTDDEPVDDHGLVDHPGSTPAKGLTGDRGLVEGHGSGADLGLAGGQGSAEGRAPVADQRRAEGQGSTGGQGFAFGHESAVDQGLAGDWQLVEGQEFPGDQQLLNDQGSTGDRQPMNGQVSSADKGTPGNQQPVATLAEARPAMATGATDHAIVISLSERALGLYQGNQLIRRYPVAIGKPSTPTPVGTHRVLEKVLHPGGALGTRWIGFTYQMHGIHGTNRPELIGQEVSNGCVRMHNPNVEEVYEIVGIGTPVVVIVAPVQSWSGLGKPTSQTGVGQGQAGAAPGQAGAGLGQVGASPGQAGKPGGLLAPSSPQPKDPQGTSQTPSPSGGASTGPAPGRTYTVQPGDSIWAIARRFGTTVEAIVKSNGIRNPELIYPGEVLKIP